MRSLAHLKNRNRRRIGRTIRPVCLRILTCGLALLPGCATRDGAQGRIEAAYQTGRHQALDEVYESRFPVVTVLGPVATPKLDWTEDLTLARAIVAARYLAPADPSRIILHRGGSRFEINPTELLAGQDWALLPGDRVEIIP